MPQRAIAGKPAQQIVECDLGSVLRAEAREPIAAAPDAVAAAHADNDVRIGGRETCAPMYHAENKKGTIVQKKGRLAGERSARGAVTKRLLGGGPRRELPAGRTDSNLSTHTTTFQFLEGRSWHRIRYLELRRNWGQNRRMK